MSMSATQPDDSDDSDTYSIRKLTTLQHLPNASMSAARRRWRQCTQLELEIALCLARPPRPVGSVQQVLQTVAKTYPNCTLRTPAAPFLPSLAAPSAVLSAPRRTCLRLALVSRPAHDPRPRDQAVSRPCMSHRCRVLAFVPLSFLSHMAAL